MSYTPQKMRLGLCFSKIITRTLTKLMCRFATQKTFRETFFLLLLHMSTKSYAKSDCKKIFNETFLTHNFFSERRTHVLYPSEDAARSLLSKKYK